ncbi:MAG: hypothetical protein AAGA48_14395 [Myxococcota bacterium]
MQTEGGPVRAAAIEQPGQVGLDVDNDHLYCTNDAKQGGPAVGAFRTPGEEAVETQLCVVLEAPLTGFVIKGQTFIFDERGQPHEVVAVVPHRLLEGVRWGQARRQDADEPGPESPYDPSDPGLTEIPEGVAFEAAFPGLLVEVVDGGDESPTLGGEMGCALL